MKIAVCAVGGALDAAFDPRFGRCPCFAIVDVETREVETVVNPGVSEGQGAGVLAAQAVSAKNVSAVIAGNIGPNAHQALAAAGIKAYVTIAATVGAAVDQFVAGSLRELTSASVAPHFGMGRGAGRGGRGMGRGRLN